MAERYVSALTGPEMDAALLDMAQHNSEAWAVGTRNGAAVSSSDETYDNNSKYYATEAEVAAARAESAVPAGTAGAVFFDRAQNLTDNQKIRARTNIAAGATNPNLLHNAWFMINQRGFTSGTTGYVADRWSRSWGSVLYTRENGGLTFDGRNATGGGSLRYRDIVPTSAFAGRYFTLSLMGIDGTIYSGSGAVPSTVGSTSISVITRNYDYGSMNFYIEAIDDTYSQITVTLFTQYEKGPFTIRSIKLEEGRFSTIQTDMPLSHAEELARCQRYFVRFTGAQYLSLGLAQAEGASTAYAAVQLPAVMRIMPTVSYNGSFHLWGGSTSNDHVVTNIQSNTGTPSTDCSYVKLKITSSGLTVGSLYDLRVPNDTTAYLDLTADI